ncbi:unnamed protein product [Rhizophagus irregularis]|nr:unnamed protein product [Rhizophagus irregularis]
MAQIPLEQNNAFIFNGKEHKDHWDERTDPTGSKIDTIVLHWDVANSSKGCFDILVKRAWQAKGVNDHSIGIEINSILINQQDPKWPRKEVYSRDPRSGVPYKHLDFTELQKTRVVQVVEALCVVGHFHTSVEKIDPGDTLWPLLYNSFSKPSPKL